MRKNKKNNIKILVAAHHEVYVPQNKYLFPIQVGTALARRKIPGMLHDNSGVNISEKNRSYCELTAQYWAWKNLEADYYGFFHYRRYMNFAKEYPVKKYGKLRTGCRTPYKEYDSIRGDLSGYCLDEASIRRIVEAYDVVTVLSERMNVTVSQQFCQFHDKADLDCAARILKRRYPEYAGAFHDYMKSKDIYFCNMYIMRREVFYGYMGWLFLILEEFEKERAKVWPREKKRAAGYLAERLFGVYYTYLKQIGVKCCELSYAVFHDTLPDGAKERELSCKKPRGFVHPRVFEMGRKKVVVDMRRINRLLPAGSIRRRIVRTMMGRFL